MLPKLAITQNQTTVKMEHSEPIDQQDMSMERHSRPPSPMVLPRSRANTIDSVKRVRLAIDSDEDEEIVTVSDEVQDFAKRLGKNLTNINSHCKHIEANTSRQTSQNKIGLTNTEQSDVRTALRGIKQCVHDLIIIIPIRPRNQYTKRQTILQERRWEYQRLQQVDNPKIEKLERKIRRGGTDKKNTRNRSTERNKHGATLEPILPQSRPDLEKTQIRTYAESAALPSRTMVEPEPWRTPPSQRKCYKTVIKIT